MAYSFISLVLVSKSFGKEKQVLNFYDLKLESLNSFTPFKTVSLKGKVSLWVLFQPNCFSCKKQLNDLKCLPPSVHTVALGINGNREKLIKALKPIPAVKDMLSFKSSPYLKKHLQTVVTPSLFLVDRNGSLVKTIEGRFSCALLKISLAKL